MRFWLFFPVIIFFAVGEITSGSKCPSCLLYVSKDQLYSESLQKILNQAMISYAGDLRGFYDFLARRDTSGWSPLMYYVADGNTMAIDLVLNVAREYYGPEKKYLIKLMRMLSPSVQNILSIAAERNQEAAVRVILNHAVQLFSQDQKAFEEFINQADKAHGWNALHFATFINAYGITRLLLEAADKVLGMGTPAFDNFINRADHDHATPLFFSGKLLTHMVLKEYGARHFDTDTFGVYAPNVEMSGYILSQTLYEQSGKYTGYTAGRSSARRSCRCLFM